MVAELGGPGGVTDSEESPNYVAVAAGSQERGEDNIILGRQPGIVIPRN